GPWGRHFSRCRGPARDWAAFTQDPTSARPTSQRRIPCQSLPKNQRVPDSALQSPVAPMKSHKDPTPIEPDVDEAFADSPGKDDSRRPTPVLPKPVRTASGFDAAFLTVLGLG